MVTQSQITRCPLQHSVSLIFRVMGFDCNILEGEMAYYSQMFLINCRYILSVFF